MAEVVAERAAGSVPSGHPKPQLSAVVIAVVTFASYMVGANRALGYDAAVSMHQFIDGPPSWALTRQEAWNNHPAFSLMEGFAADVTGSTAEWVMRIAPALFASAAVALMVWRIGSRWSWRAGVSAGAALACHPLVIDFGREPRGYTLGLLAIVVMGIAVLDVRSPVLFAVAASIGVGAHLYVAVPSCVLLSCVAANGQWSDRWRRAGASGLSGGGLFYAGMVTQLGRADDARLFRPSYPLRAAEELLGRGPVPVFAFSALLAIALYRTHGRRSVIVPVGVGLVGVIGPWIVAPHDLYPRFIYWAVPALALGAAWAVHRVPHAALLMMLAGASSVIPHLASWMDDEMPAREMAQRAGSGACVVGEMPQQLSWYADDLRLGDDCAVVALIESGTRPKVVAFARERWPTVCWMVDGAQVRAVSRGDCPPDRQ